MFSPWASSQAKQTCPEEALLLNAISSNLWTIPRFLEKFSLENRGAIFRKSLSSKSSTDLYFPVMKPRPKGL